MTDIIIINLICQAIFSGKGYIYKVSSNISSDVLQDPDCEKAWYRKAPGNESKLECLSDGQLHVNQSKLVVDVSEKNITITKCIELRHNVTCHGSNQKFQHLYRVTDISNATNSTITANSTNTYFPHTTIIKLITIAIPIIITIIFIIGIGVRFWEHRSGSNHDHAVSADQNGDAGRMSMLDQQALPSNQNNGDCATVNMNDYENDGMKKCRSSNC